MAQITGIVKLLTEPIADIPVHIYLRSTGELIDSTTSAIDGTFEFNDLDEVEKYTVVALSDNPNFNDAIDDGIEAQPVGGEWWINTADSQIGDPYYYYSESVYSTQVEIRNMTVVREGTGGEAYTVSAVPLYGTPVSVTWETPGDTPVYFAPVDGDSSIWGPTDAIEAPTLTLVSDEVWVVTVGDLTYTPGSYEDLGVLRVKGADPCLEMSVYFITSTDSYSYPQIIASQNYICWE